MPSESTCNGEIGQITEDFLPAHTETKKKPEDLEVNCDQLTTCILLLLSLCHLEALGESSPALTHILSLHRHFAFLYSS